MTVCGTSNAYNKGCRCDPCREARSRYMADRRPGRRLGTQDIGDIDEVAVPFTALPVRGEWRDSARCAELIATGDARADWWYIEERVGARYDRARKICATCPVATECLQWAIELPEKFGMWGGLTPHERRPLQRAMRATCVICAAEFTFPPATGGKPKFCSDSCRRTSRLRRNQKWNINKRGYAGVDA